MFILTISAQLRSKFGAEKTYKSTLALFLFACVPLIAAGGGGVSRGETARKMREGLSCVVSRGQVRGANGEGRGKGQTEEGLQKEMWKGYGKWDCL